MFYARWRAIFTADRAWATLDFHSTAAKNYLSLNIARSFVSHFLNFNDKLKRMKLPFNDADNPQTSTDYAGPTLEIWRPCTETELGDTVETFVLQSQILDHNIHFLHRGAT